MADRTWCDECQSMQVIDDQFVEDTGDSRTYVEEYVAMHLACGHSTNTTPRRVRKSPLQQAGPPRSLSLPDPFEEER